MKTKLEITGWLLSDTINWVSCPKCNSPEGIKCRQPSGRLRWPPHMERVGKLQKDYPDVAKAACKPGIIRSTEDVMKSLRKRS